MTALVLVAFFAAVSWSLWRLASRAAAPAPVVPGGQTPTFVEFDQATDLGATALVDSVVIDLVLVDDHDRGVILITFRTVDDKRIALLIRADRWGSAIRRLVDWQTKATPLLVRGSFPAGVIALEPSGNRRGLVVEHLPRSVPVVS